MDLRTPHPGRGIAGLLLALSAAGLACGPNAPAGETAAAPGDGEASPYTVWNVGAQPTAVSIDGASVYVAHLGADTDTDTDGGATGHRGWVGAYNANGQLTDTLLAGLTAPRASVVRDDTLYLADGDSLRAVDLGSGDARVVASFPVGEGGLTALAPGRPGLLYAATGAAGGGSAVWRVTTATGRVEPVCTLPGIRGIAYDDERLALYAVTSPTDAPDSGRVHLIDVETWAQRVVGSYTGALSAVYLGADSLYLADQSGGADGGRIVAVATADQGTRTVAADPLFAAPAQFGVLGGVLALVPMRDGNRVVAVRLE